jgi:hypothetical protein
VLFNKKKSKVIRETVSCMSGKSWLGEAVSCMSGKSWLGEAVSCISGKSRG